MISSNVPVVVWLKASNCLILSNVSQKKSSRIGLSDVAGKTSKISPLMANSPASRTISTRKYPPCIKISTNADIDISWPGVRVTPRFSKDDCGGRRFNSPKAETTRISTSPVRTADNVVVR